MQTTLDLNHRLQEAEKRWLQKRTSDQGKDTVALTDPLRTTVTKWECDRRQVIQVKEEDSGRSKLVPCRSRDCPGCRPRLNERDEGRVDYSLPGDTVFYYRVHRSMWDRIRQDGHRKGYHPIKIPSAVSDYIEVVSDGPPPFETNDIEAVMPKSQAREFIQSLIEDIPAGQDNRLTGVGLISIKDWEIMMGNRVEPDEPTEVIQAPRGTTLEEVETLAIALQVEHWWEGNSLFFPQWEDLVKVNQALLDKDTSRGWG